MIARMMGAVLVAAGCAWKGFQAAEELKKTGQSFRETIWALALAERELELGAPPLSELLSRVAARSCGEVKVLLDGCAQGVECLDQESFSAVWSGRVGQMERLGREGRAALYPLGDILGRYDSDGQREGISAVRRQMEEIERHWEQECQNRGRVYRALGLSGGAFLVILLL